MKEDHSVDFLKEKYQLHPEREQRFKAKRLAKFIGAFFVVAAVTGTAFSYKIANMYMGGVEDPSGFTLLSSLERLVASEEKNLTGEEDDRINILLLGIGGAGHDGPELTDTIIFGSYKPSTSEVGLLSIPRDMIVEIPDYGYRKINHANAFGELEAPGYGRELAAQVVSEVLDQDIDYTIKIDFNGFEELIDAIGGVDVYVERTFTDYTYPADNYKYQTVHFEKGWQKMDGETALEYARSRHGNNGEGSDFARAERQQKVLMAVKEKVLTPSTLLNPAKLNKVLETVKDNVKTDLTVWEMVKLAKYAPSISEDNIAHHVLDSSPTSPLFATTINGAYVLQPKKDDWSDLQAIAQNIFASAESTTESVPTKSASTAKARVEIQNGTSITGLAFQTSQLLAGTGFEVAHIGNAEGQRNEKTIIYDLTEGRKSEELEILKEFFEADVSMTPGGWVYSNEVVPRELTVTTPGEEYVTSGEPVDFLIILGENAEGLVLR